MCSFGRNIILESYGYSHDAFMQMVLKGIPAGIKVDFALIARDLQRRRPVHKYDSPRIEPDNYDIISGVTKDGYTDGHDIVVRIANKTFNDEEYSYTESFYRPSHGDYTWEKKFGEPIPCGGGNMSGRETVVRVMAGALAKMFITQRLVGKNDVVFNTWVYSIGNVISHDYSDTLSDEMVQLLCYVRDMGDSVGGSVKCVIKNLPAGLGELPFAKFHAMMSYAMISIPAARSFEIGRGLEATRMYGSEHNDCYGFDESANRIRPMKNDAGGVLGGITSGEDVIMTIGFKPISSIRRTQITADKKGKMSELTVKGSHDVCCVPRAVVVVEAMAALVVADFLAYTSFAGCKKEG